MSSASQYNTFLNIKGHLPSLSPFNKLVKVDLKGVLIIFVFNYTIKDTVISKETYVWWDTTTGISLI